MFLSARSAWFAYSSRGADQAVLAPRWRERPARLRQASRVRTAAFSESIALRVPPGYAFEFLADPSTAPIIDPSVIEYRPDEVPMRQGVRVNIRMRAWGVPTKLESVVTEWVPGQRMVMKGVRPRRPMTVTAIHTFNTSAEGCIYSWAMAFEPNAPLGRLVAALSCRFMHRNAQRQQQRFKTHVEAGWQAEPNRDDAVRRG